MAKCFIHCSKLTWHYSKAVVHKKQMLGKRAFPGKEIMPHNIAQTFSIVILLSDQGVRKIIINE